MAAANPSASGSKVQVVSVHLSRSSNQKKYSILKFNESNNVDFRNCGTAKLERENNFKEFKSAYDLDTMPKFGAGSEFGREQKEEARKKKYGIKIKKYNPQEQPWLLKLGSGKQARRFKGIRKGGILENASYYIFTQRDDGAFEAVPVSEWFDFMPVAKYKSLNAEEAEEEYLRRGKTLNHFAIMLSKRLKAGGGDDADGDDGETSTKKKSSAKKDRSLMLTENDEWGNSDEDDDDEDDNLGDRDEDGEDKPKKRKAKDKKDESDNEAIEEQDELDEGQEIDYISGSSSDDEQMYDETGRGESNKYEERGVVDEEGLKKLLDSDDEDEEEKKDEENDEEEEKTKEENGSESESSSDSDMDSDPEKDFSFTSPLFFQEKKPVKKQFDDVDSNSASRSTTPLPDSQSNGKRKRPETQSPSNLSKKQKTDGSSGTGASNTASAPSASTAGSAGSSSQGNGGIEGLVKRYLSRKPITLKDLLQKVTSKYPSMPKDQIVKVVGQIMQRLKLDKTKANNKFYFSIKKDTSS